MNDYQNNEYLNNDRLNYERQNDEMNGPIPPQEQERNAAYRADEQERNETYRAEERDDALHTEDRTDYSAPAGPAQSDQYNYRPAGTNERQNGFDRGYSSAESAPEPPRPAMNGPEAPSFDRAPSDGAYQQAFRPQQYAEPDYRAAYGVRYDPYAGAPVRPAAPRADRGQYAQGHGVHTYVNGGTQTRSGSTGTHEYVYSSKEAKKPREKKTVSLRSVVWILVAAILCSAIVGAGGVFVGTKIASSGASNGGKGEVNKQYGSTVNYEQGENTVTPDGSVAAAAAIAADTVVEITTEQKVTNSFFGQYVQSGAGSGVIISENGQIITCAHVVEDATSITVRLTNGDSFKASVLGSDSRTDIAVLKIDATGLPYARIGDSDKVVVGQTAIAIGNPLGTLGGTVTSGIISTLNREIKIDGQTYTLLQLDASINPGNSGGGLFDINGNLIGIVNAKSSGSSMSSTTIEGLGFAIPINQAIEVASQLSDKGYVGGRVNLGIYVVEINENVTTTDLYNAGYSDLLNYITEYGVYFVKYQAGQNGDFKYGDRIIAVDGTSVSGRSDIQDILDSHSIGDTVTVTVSRMNADMRRAQIVEVTVNLIEYVPDANGGN